MLVIVVVGAIAMFLVMAFLRWLFTWTLRLSVFAFIAFIAYVFYFYGNDKSSVHPAAVAATEPGAGCTDDYRLCGDNDEVLWHNSPRMGFDHSYDGRGTLWNACQYAAEDKGADKNKMPPDAYTEHTAGHTFIDTGIAVLTYRGSVCTFDLKAGLVKSVSPEEDR